MWKLGRGWEDEAALAQTWRAATPFPYLVFDDFVAPEAHGALLAVVDEEPLHDYQAEIYAFEASAPDARTEGFRSLREALAEVVAPALSRITGKALRRADMRAYAYRPGHYLLPHSDHQEGVGRSLAYAYYLPSPEPPEGGELELFTCVHDAAREVIATRSALLIEPRANRLVVFQVSDVSLHQVREVLAGLRISLSGWFYP